MVEIPQKIVGRWKSGIALDFPYDPASAPIGYNEAGHMQFDTVRPEIAQLLYRLKYQSDQNAAEGIITIAAAYLRPHVSKFDIHRSSAAIYRPGGPAGPYPSPRYRQ